MTRHHQAERQEAIDHLREMLKPGDTVYTILRHVSRSGMSRVIDCQVIQVTYPEPQLGENGEATCEPRWIGGRVAQAIGETYDDRRQGLRVSGCGMDMGFHVVYGLSRVLFPEFQCIGEKCPANDHYNGDRNYRPHQHSDGGYALRHRWI